MWSNIIASCEIKNIKIEKWLEFFGDVFKIVAGISPGPLAEINSQVHKSKLKH